MIAYGINILLIIKDRKREIPNVTQPWYADYSGALGMFSRIHTYFDFLTLQGPVHGYHHKPSKRVLIVHPENLDTGKEFMARHGFKV